VPSAGRAKGWPSQPITNAAHCFAASCRTSLAASAMPNYLRFGVCVRRHPGRAQLARPFHAARRHLDHAAVPRGLVGVGLHHLDHQLAQSRADAGPGASFRPDVCWPRAIDLDSTGLWGARCVVCIRLCRDAGRPHSVLVVVRSTWAGCGAVERDPHSHLAWRIGGVLGVGWDGAECRSAAGALGGRARHRICRTDGAVLDSEIRGVRGRGLVCRGRMAERCAAFIIIALGGSLSRCAPRLRSDGEWQVSELA